MLQVLLINTIAKPIWEKRWLWVFYIAIWTLHVLLLDTLTSVQHILLLFALVIFVVPHGSADFFLPAWILNPPWEKRLSYWATALGLAFLSALITLGVWKLSTNFSIALFSAVMMWHWGSLDTIQTYPHRGPSWVIGSMGRGMLVVIAPLYFKPLETQELILNLLGTDQSFILATLYSFSIYLLILGILLEATAVVVHKFVEGHGLPPAFSAYVTETVVLLLTFAWVSPLISITFYFLIMHSFRQICRVPAYIPEARGTLIEGGGLLKYLSYHYQKTAFFTFLALLALCSWFGWKLYTGSTLAQASLQSILPLLLLLIPHALISLLADFNPKQMDG